MNNFFYTLLFFCVVTFLSAPADGQILKKIENKAKQKKDQKENEAINKIFDKKDDSQKSDKDNKDSGNTEVNSNNPNDPEKATKKDIDLWTVKYDFVPGSKVIFYDDLETETVGEIPSKWKYEGGGVEAVKMGNNKVLKWWDKETRPAFKDDFVLPDEFTVEFDVFLQGPPKAGYGYNVRFYNKESRSVLNFVDIGYGGIGVHSVTDIEFVPEKKKEDFYNTWNHISLSYNKGSLKGYFDQYRLFNARVDKRRFDHISFYNCCTTTGNDHLFVIDNIRIAEGAHPKYKEDILEGGKIVTNNIHFAYNSADILPHSYAEINRIADVMKENSGMNFSVQGHTDSDGNEDYNKTLSEKRANAVLEALVKIGIDRSRLESKGFGELVPVVSNDSPENKAMNRRVEFVKK